jgi:carbonic anhydrase
VDVRVTDIRVDQGAPPLVIAYGHSAVDLRYVEKDADCAHRGAEETEEADVVPGTAHVTFAGVVYDLVQFHFHTPSEHTFNGVHAPLEMHLVHRSADGRTLVVAVPLRVGGASSVDAVLAHLTPECGTPEHLADVDLNTLLPRNHATLRYTGSLTTSPFSGPVQWFLMPEQHVTAATVARFQHLFVDGNARETQPLAGRTLVLHR